MKVWAYLAIFMLVIGGLGTAAAKIHKAGYNKRDLEINQAAIKEQNAAIEKRMAEWIATQDAAEPIILIEEKIVEKIRVVEKDVPRVVEKIVQIKPECSDLGPDYTGLLNDAVRASNQGSDPGAAITDNVDD